MTLRHRCGKRYVKAEHVQGREASTMQQDLSAIRMTREEIQALHGIRLLRRADLVCACML